MDSHGSGNYLERKTQRLHIHEDISIHPVIKIPGYYTKKGKVKSYQPDILTPTRVIECKNDENGGAPEKLPQAVLKQKKLAEVTGTQGFLIYEGTSYEWYINNDPIMLQVMESFPEVIVTSFANYKKNYS